MIRIGALALALGLTASAAAAVPVTWVDWTEVTTGTNGTTVTGSLTIGSEVVGVTYNNPLGISFAQTNGLGTNYWSPSQPYTSVGVNGVDNAPPGTDIVALQFAGLQTLTFSRAISNVYFAFVSLNGNGYGFDRPFQILSSGGQNIDGNGVDACGFWGCGTSSASQVGAEYQLLGTGEPHGTLLLDGSFTTLTWRSLSSENWNGFTVGVAGITRVPDPDPTSPIPLPAAGFLLLAGLGGLASLRRRA